jgi:predicted N-acyltransferase
METRIHASIRAIPLAEWRRIEDPHSPFQDYEFHQALEDAGVVGEKLGQRPIYFTLWDDGLVAAAVLYLKTHSYGEYIFDWQWAQEAERAGIPYYPKLMLAQPFTPASAAKLLVADARWRAPLLAAIRDFWQRSGTGGMHALFVGDEEAAAFRELGFLERASHQYHFQVSGLTYFADFIDKLKARKAKNILAERAALADMTIWRKTGAQLSGADGAGFYPYYRSTIDDKEGIAYLTEDFFRLVAERMPDRLMLVGTEGAQALFFHKGSRLYGRYWGALAPREFLHFELCYYQGIEFAIERGLTVFEAGAQGEHKLLRGFVPVRIRSFHEVSHPGLRQALVPFLQQEEERVAAMMIAYAKALPFKASEKY